MPYFSFSLNNSFPNSQLNKNLIDYKLKINTLYYSKDTNIWKILNKKKNSIHILSLKFEVRNEYIKNSKSVIFFLPPSIGLGDAIEYALAIEKIIKEKIFKKIGVAFVGNYKFIFSNLFKIKNVYESTINQIDLNKFDTCFHFSKEILSINNQKNNRANIEKDVCDFFNIKISKSNKKEVRKITKITLFPISSSPIRTMPFYLVNSIIEKLSNKIKIDVVVDKLYPTSNYLIKNIDTENINLVFHEKISDLVRIVKKIDYGIFMDSGPLHLAKKLNKNGLLIETSVSHKILLNNNKNIDVIKNSFSSDFCSAPCGLINIFNLNDSLGCYETNHITKKELGDIKNFKPLQRGNLKESYIKFMEHPVGCVKDIDLKKILNTIENLL